MWLIECDGDVFEGTQVWLRPGKKYLLGRGSGGGEGTAGTIVIADKTISRKHATIQIDEVKEGDGGLRESRSRVTIEDLKTKIGTVVNGKQIKGSTLVLTEPENTIKLGHFAKLFRLRWHPIVLTFSFSSREERTDPWSQLRGRLEQLDIKFIDDFDRVHTTHLVHKKRNTPRGLQALINGRYIVTESYVDAICEAALPGENGGPSPLELDFAANWPNPLAYLPPRGDEPSIRPVEAYGPDPRRRDIFDGYTFIFFDQSQYDNLMPVITNGKGKALLREVVPFKTQPDDLVRYVKEVAGEKGLGEFEDGSEGKGVVVVRFAPSREGELRSWYWEFVSEVMKRLDHRMIEQKEFLDAILAVQPGILRRPLEFESTPCETPAPEPSRRGRADPSAAAPMAAEAADDAPGYGIGGNEARDTIREKPKDPTPPLQMTPPRAARRKGRFRGFDTDDEDEASAAEPPPEPIVQQQEQSQRMFVSQAYESQEPESVDNTRRSTRSSLKRAYSPPASVGEDTEMRNAGLAESGISKRRRIAESVREASRRLKPPVIPESDSSEGEAAVLLPPVTAPVPETAPETPVQPVNVRKGAIDNEVLEAARQRLVEVEAKAKREEELNKFPDDGYTVEQLAQIRKLTLVEEIPVRERGSGNRTREQDIADGRWDPRWNGRQNFKRFRKATRSGEGAAARPLIPRILVSYVVEKNKGYGIGDEYWLDDPSTLGRSKKPQSQDQVSTSSVTMAGPVMSPPAPGNRQSRAPISMAGSSRDDDDEAHDPPQMSNRPAEEDEDEDDDQANEDEEEEPVLPRTRKGKAAETAASQRQPRTQSQATSRSAATTATTTTRATKSQLKSGAASGKRPAPMPASNPRPTKKTALAVEVEISDSDDDDDDDGGGRFRFGKR